MSSVNAGFDVHRTQITFDALDAKSGEVTTGRIAATPEAVERWVGRFAGREVHVALEACTGWYFVAPALERAGAVPHLAEVAETRAASAWPRRSTPSCGASPAASRAAGRSPSSSGSAR